MAENFERSRGRAKNYKLDRGGMPADFGPFYGIVKNTYDKNRTGRIEVYIEAFADQSLDEEDSSKWIPVSYLPSFFGSTPYNPSTSGTGSYIDGNSNSYGMWFTPPDVGITVLCVFANGDRSQGYYIGVVPDQTIGHMVPAIGGSTNWVSENKNQSGYFNGATRVPVVEINTNNLAYEEAAKYFDKPKPVHAAAAETMFKQGLLKDPERGPIGSTSQRESPSSVFGISTPGTPIYQGGLKPGDIQTKIDTGKVKPQDFNVIGRVGGHSFVMDDGDIHGENRLIRFRTTAGHQITMSDSGDFLYIMHANGLSWIELGAEGTVDVYATNSVNFRTKGDFNVHAERDINLFAGRDYKVKAKRNIRLEAEVDFKASAQEDFKLYSKRLIAVKSDGSISLDSKLGGSWNGGKALIFQAKGIDLNGPPAPTLRPMAPLTKTILDDTTFTSAEGWKVKKESLESIVSRTPTHEPYPYHNKGVDIKVDIEKGKPTPNPSSVPLPPGVEIKRKS